MRRLFGVTDVELDVVPVDLCQRVAARFGRPCSCASGLGEALRAALSNAKGHEHASTVAAPPPCAPPSTALIDYAGLFPPARAAACEPRVGEYRAARTGAARLDARAFHRPGDAHVAAHRPPRSRPAPLSVIAEHAGRAAARVAARVGRAVARDRQRSEMAARPARGAGERRRRGRCAGTAARRSTRGIGRSSGATGAARAGSAVERAALRAAHGGTCADAASARRFAAAASPPTRFPASTTSPRSSPRPPPNERAVQGDGRPASSGSPRRPRLPASCMHGFLNLLAAAALARASTLETLDRIVAEEDPGAFAFDDDIVAMARRTRRRSPNSSACARRRSSAYGSCSFTEPVDDLTALGILPPQMIAPRRYDRPARSSRGSGCARRATFRFKTYRSGVFVREAARRRIGMAIGDRILDLAAVAESGLARRRLRAPNCWRRRCSIRCFAAGRGRGARCASASRCCCAATATPRLRVANADHFFVARDAAPHAACPWRSAITSTFTRRSNTRRISGASSVPTPSRCCRTGAGFRSVTTGARARSSSTARRCAVRAVSANRPTPRRRLRPHRRCSTSSSRSASSPAAATSSACRCRRPSAASTSSVFVLVNDWSARDIQAWEYQPLGPFLRQIVRHDDLAVGRDARRARAVSRRRPGRRSRAPLQYLRVRDPGRLRHSALGRAADAAHARRGVAPADDFANELSPTCIGTWRSSWRTRRPTARSRAPAICLRRERSAVRRRTVRAASSSSTWNGERPIALPDGETAHVSRRRRRGHAARLVREARRAAHRLRRGARPHGTGCVGV